MASILVVEDDLRVASHLCQGLKENGFAADLASDGEQALRQVLSGSYDLILLDIMLPKLDGWTVLSELRRQGSRTPVIVLTARDALEDRNRGLKLGAESYLVKPVGFSELVARLRSLLRLPSRPAETAQLGDLRINWAERRAWRAGKSLDLTAREFSLLSLLVRHAGETLPVSFIAQQVWEIDWNGDAEAVESAVRRLRRKIDEPFSESLIRAVPGLGYVLEEPRTQHVLPPGPHASC